MNEARTFARDAVAEMVRDGIAEVAHWRGWQWAADLGNVNGPTECGAT